MEKEIVLLVRSVIQVGNEKINFCFYKIFLLGSSKMKVSSSSNSMKQNFGGGGASHLKALMKQDSSENRNGEICCSGSSLLVNPNPI